jgi:hypothetical protein
MNESTARQIVLAAGPHGKPKLTDFRLEEIAIPMPKNRILPNTNHSAPFDLTTTPTLLQQRAFELLGVNYRM